MMTTRLLLVAIMIGLPCMAQAAPTVQPTGTFQTVVSEGRILITDTSTGHCWSQSVVGSMDWVDHGSPADAKPAKIEPPLALDLPRDTMGMMVHQRTRKSIPGSNGRLHVRLDDITAGKTLLSIETDRGDVLLEETLVRRGDIVSFAVGSQPYHLKVVELINHLVGNDVAVLSLSTERQRLEDEEAAAAHVTRQKEKNNEETKPRERDD